MIELALAALENDKQRNELAIFYEQFKNRFYNIAYSKLHNLEESEDALQETFLRIAENPNKFFEMSNQERVRFVDGIVRHISVDKFKKSQKTNAVSIDDIGDDIASDTISPEEKYITDASADELVQFVLTLPESQRQTLFMYIHENLSYPEISKILGISEELARKRVSNARKAIKDFAERNK